jgi:hypothetical protein
MQPVTTAAVVVALLLGALIGYGLVRLADEQHTGNCIAAAEARNPVELANPVEAAGGSANPDLLGFGERQDAVDACDPPTN